MDGMDHTTQSLGMSYSLMFDLAYATLGLRQVAKR